MGATEGGDGKRGLVRAGLAGDDEDDGTDEDEREEQRGDHGEFTVVRFHSAPRA
jgi:hypothetical protein